MARVVLLGCAAVLALAARAQEPGPVLSRVEAGLDDAVGWKWRIEQGAVRPGTPAPPSAPRTGAPTPTPAGQTYTVVKGDALATIAARHRITVGQLKHANNLTSNLIHPGDVLRIPSAQDLAAMPAAIAPQAAPAAPGSAPPPVGPGDFDPEVLLLQVYLDGLGFSSGPIDGQGGLRFQRLMHVYQGAHGSDSAALTARARESVGDPLTTYSLRPEDMRWIAAPRPAKKVAPEQRVSAAYAALVAEPELLYRSAFEFVAERFHCDENFLRRLNPTIKPNPPAGTIFRVPNVRPFDIAAPLPQRPAADPETPVTAVISGLQRLEISRGGQLVAAFPVSVARPGLRGRGEWLILDSIAWPRLVTRRERREDPRPHAAAETVRPAVLASDEVLGPGPRNPVGVLWMNLAKAEDTAPLAFGLHGTSIPDRMAVTESLGGFRMTNWDVVRAAALLPEKTPLRWRATMSRTPTVAPAAATAPAAAAATPDRPPPPTEPASIAP